MSSALVEAVEQHRFDPIQRLYWRNHELDFSNPANLLKSLTQPPPLRGLTAGRVASDVTTLESLMLDPDIRESARGKHATMLLWDVCQIPDFRKLGDDSHTRLCARLYMHLLKEGSVPANWMEGHIRGLAKTEGDIDTLMHRLTGVRVCSYVAARTEWSRHSAIWQERAREVEDQLSDALHERLTARFVDRRATTLLRRLDNDGDRTLLSAVKPDGEVLVEGHSIGRIRGFTLETDVASGPERQMILRAGRKALIHEIPRRIRMLQDAPDTSLRLDSTNGEVFWEDTPLGRLTAGTCLLRPAILLFPAEFTDTVQKNHVETRLLSFVANLIQTDLKPLYRSQTLAEREPQLRAILHRLMEDGGITETLPEDHALPPILRNRLRKGGVEVGRFSIYCPPLFRNRPLALLGLLHALHSKTPLRPTAPGRVSLPWSDIHGQFGWIRAADTGLRLDIAERCIADMHHLALRRDHAAPTNLASRLGVKAEMLPAVLKGLGIAHQPPETQSATHAGPPRPLMILNDRKTRAARRRRPAAHQAPTKRPSPPRTDSPFAALAALREKIGQ